MIVETKHSALVSLAQLKRELPDCVEAGAGCLKLDFGGPRPIIFRGFHDHVRIGLPPGCSLPDSVASALARLGWIVDPTDSIVLATELSASDCAKKISLKLPKLLRKQKWLGVRIINQKWLFTLQFRIGEIRIRAYWNSLTLSAASDRADCLKLLRLRMITLAKQLCVACEFDYADAD